MAAMTLVRVWRSHLLGGVGAAALVPVTLLGSIAALGLAGGFGGLSALGQAFSGPSVPASALHNDRRGASARPVPAALAAALSAGVPASAAAVPGGSIQAGGASASSGGASTAGSQPQASNGAPGTGSGGVSARPRQATAGPSPARGPEIRPQPQPTVAGRVVAAGTAVTSQVPGPAGPAATKALQSTGSTLDSIAPIKAP
jgi:hypothetical protein